MYRFFVFREKNYAYHYELASTEDTGKFLSKREFFGPNPIEILAERLPLIEDDSGDNIIYLKKQYDDTSLENLKNALSLYGEKGKKVANSILAYNSSGNENLELNAMLTIEKNNVKHEDSDSKEEKSIKEVDEIYDYLLENHFKRSDFFDEKKEKLSNLVGEGYEEFVFKVNSLSESAYQQLLSLFDGDKEVKFRLLDEKERGSISIKIKNDSCSKIRNLKYHFVLFHYCISSQRAL